MFGLYCETLGEKDSLREVANATDLSIFAYSGGKFNIFVDRERWSSALAYFMKAKVRTMC